MPACRDCDVHRRDFLLLAAAAGALGTSEALRPRRKIDYLGKARLDEVIPAHIGYWRASGGNDIIAPSTLGSLSSLLYNQTVARSYIDEKDEARRIMFLAAYGREQNDALQLHRPESCYPAVGFVIRSRTLRRLPLWAGVAIPVVVLTVQYQDRVEDIVYWTRMADYLPQTSSEQRIDRLRMSLRGFIGDGVLVRASAIRTSDEPLYERVSGFLKGLLATMTPSTREILVGPEQAHRLGSSQPQVVPIP